MWTVVAILLYAAVVWWLRDGGRTPVAAIVLHRTGGYLRGVALDLGALSLDMQRWARKLIEDRSLS